MCLALSLSLWMMLTTSVSAQDNGDNVPCPVDCACKNYSYGSKYDCSGILIEIDTGYFKKLTINCNGSYFDDNKLPKHLNAINGQLYGLYIERCTGLSSTMEDIISSYNATGISSLSLQDPITPLDEDTLKGLGSLKSFYVTDKGAGQLRNRTDILPPNIFQRSPLLTEVLLIKYFVEVRFDQGDISSLSHLEQVNIIGARKLILGKKAISNLTMLKHVKLTESNMTEIPEDLFYGSNAISALDISSNGLTEIPEKLFLNMSTLMHLYLSNNMLERVTRELFEPLTGISQIQLDGNRLTSLPDFLFFGKKLSGVSFARNRIENITEYTFLGLPYMRNMDLSHNVLSWNCWNQTQEKNIFGHLTGESVLKNLRKLDMLDLSHNRIQSMCYDWSLVSENLNLSYNRIESLTVYLTAWGVDVSVYLNDNNITTVYPHSKQTVHTNSEFYLGSNPFNCDCHLHSLLSSLNHHYNLRGAQCNEPKSLKNVSLLELADRLDSLTCSANASESCECLFRPNKQRIECTCKDTLNIPLPKSTFDISDMKLKLLKSQQDLTDLPDFVTELDLSGLELESIPDVPNTVRVLDLRNNNLQVIPSDVYSKSVTLMLENNSLQCDCVGTANVKNLRANRLKILDFSDLLCSDGAFVLEKDPDHLCDVFQATVISISCVIALLILLIAIVLLYKYMPEVQVMLFQIGLQGLVREEWIDKGKIYDIFLSYSIQDEPFVKDVLLLKLEEMNYKVCEHTRDWEIGLPIPEQIYTSVANSKKTLFVISKNFMKSVWVLEEFNATILQGAKDKRNRAVIIILDDVDLNQAPLTVKCQIALNTYIKWDATDTSFWKKLQNALPKKLTAEEIRKRQKALKAVKSLGAGKSIILNGDGRLVNAAASSTSLSASPDVAEIETTC